MGVPAERGGMTMFSGSSSMPRIRPGHQDPFRRRTQTSAPTSASAPVTPPGHSSSPAQLPIALCLCSPLSTHHHRLPLQLLPRTDQSQGTSFSSPGNQEGPRVKNPETARGVSPREPGPRRRRGDGSSSEEVGLGRAGGEKKWKERRGRSLGKEEEGSGRLGVFVGPFSGEQINRWALRTRKAHLFCLGFGLPTPTRAVVT